MMKVFSDCNVICICKNYYYVFIVTVIPTNVSSRYSLLIISPKEDRHYNLSAETKLYSPAVTAPLQTANLQIWPTSTKNTRLQPVLHRSDLPNSAKWSTLSLVVTEWRLKITVIIEYLQLLKITLKEACNL